MPQTKIVTVGIDQGKKIFHVVGLYAGGAVDRRNLGVDLRLVGLARELHQPVLHIDNLLEISLKQIA